MALKKQEHCVGERLYISFLSPTWRHHHTIFSIQERFSQQQEKLKQQHTNTHIANMYPNPQLRRIM